MFLSTSGIGDKQIFSSNFICKNYFWIEISFELFLQIVQIVNRLENCSILDFVLTKKIIGDIPLGFTFVPKIWIIPFELRLYFVWLRYFPKMLRRIFKLTLNRWRSQSFCARQASIQNLIKIIRALAWITHWQIKKHFLNLQYPHRDGKTLLDLPIS